MTLDPHEPIRPEPIRSTWHRKRSAYGRSRLMVDLSWWSVLSQLLSVTSTALIAHVRSTEADHHYSRCPANVLSQRTITACFPHTQQTLQRTLGETHQRIIQGSRAAEARDHDHAVTTSIAPHPSSDRNEAQPQRGVLSHRTYAIAVGIKSTSLNSTIDQLPPTRLRSTTVPASALVCTRTGQLPRRSQRRPGYRDS